jgi:hypothetical protein
MPASRNAEDAPDRRLPPALSDRTVSSIEGKRTSVDGTNVDRFDTGTKYPVGSAWVFSFL